MTPAIETEQERAAAALGARVVLIALAAVTVALVVLRVVLRVVQARRRRSPVAAVS